MIAVEHAHAGPYQTAVADYHRAGWQGILPIPAGAKWAPPDGYTGHQGQDPDNPTLAAWKRHHHTANIALRMPAGVIGIDTDNYGSKKGAAELANLEQTYGPLPATWTSTSRGAGPSRIAFYRCPDQLVLPGKLAPAIEAIQRHHRYAVVWPSTVEGRTYRWYTPDGNPADRPPRTDELAWLPAAWHDIQKPARPTPDAHYTPRAVEGDWSKAVSRYHGEGVAGLASPGGRHDNMLPVIMTLVRLDHDGHPGAAEALDDLRSRFVAAISDRSGPAEALGEWDRMETGAEAHVAVTPSLRGTYEDLRADYRDLHDIASIRDLLPTQPADSSRPADTVETLDDVEPAKLGNWQPADLAAVYANGLTRPTPTILTRTDGNGLLYPGRTNTIFGESGAGKTWALYIAAAQQIANGDHVLILDWEDDAVAYLTRMTALGLPVELVIANSTYYPIGEGAVREDLEAIDSLIAERNTSFIGIDSTGEAIAAQGWNQDKDNEVAMWMGALPRRWARLGPCVTMLDHMPHGGGREIGSQRKRAGVSGAAYEAIATEPFAKGKPGTLTFKVAKDRGGNYAKGTEQAVIQFTPNDDGTLMGFEVQDGTGRFVASGVKGIGDYCDAVMEFMAQVGKANQTTICNSVTGDNTALRHALKRLVAEKRLTLTVIGKSNLYSVGNNESA